jgi:hypothetical protein
MRAVDMAAAGVRRPGVGRAIGGAVHAHRVDGLGERLQCARVAMPLDWSEPKREQN